MNFFRKNIYTIILLTFSVLFFCLYNYLNFSSYEIFNSPDETANFQFAKNVAEHKSFFYYLPKDFKEFNTFVHPRSTFVFEDQIAPVSFATFMILSGFFGKLFGVTSIVYFSSLLLILAILAFYEIIKKIFDKHTAFLSAVLFFFLPAVLYYTSRSMFHNITFVALLIIGLWFILCQPFKKRIWFNDFFGMSIFMLGILVRPNEIAWLGLTFFFTIIYLRKKIDLSRLVTWSMVAFWSLYFYFILNFYLYGNFANPYISSNSLSVGNWYSFLFPFGIHLVTIVKAVFYYFFGMNILYGMSVFLSGLFFTYLFLKKKLTSSQNIYFVILLLVSLFLFIYYGSHRDALFELKTVTVAYVRYWLILFIGFLPLVSFLLIKFISNIKIKSLRAVVLSLYLAFFIFFSISIVYHGPDGLINIKNQLGYMSNVQDWTVDNTAQDAIIVTDREDKYFWPKRAIIVDFYNQNIGLAMHNLLEKNEEMYYFVDTKSEEEQQKMVDYLQTLDLEVQVYHKFNSHTLYKLNLK